MRHWILHDSLKQSQQNQSWNHRSKWVRCVTTETVVLLDAAFPISNYYWSWLHLLLKLLCSPHIWQNLKHSSLSNLHLHLYLCSIYTYVFISAYQDSSCLYHLHLSNQLLSRCSEKKTSWSLISINSFCGTAFLSLCVGFWKDFISSSCERIF